MDENRIIDIETKLAHQEDLVDELNQVLIDQQTRISQLEELCRTLAERLQSIGEARGTTSPDDEQPPHY